MDTKVEQAQSGTAPDELIAMFCRATHPQEMELIADYLAEAGDARAILPLLARLGDRRVQQDPDVEDAVCRALMALGVMCSSGNHRFRLRPRPQLADDVVEMIRECSTTIPWQYFGRCH